MSPQRPLHTDDLQAQLGREPCADAIDGNGWTDLHYAALLDAAEPAKRLIEAGVDASARIRSDGEELDGEVPKALYRFGFKFLTWQREGETPLHLAAWSNAARVARVLIESGADVHATIVNGWTPLHVSARYDAADIARLLLAHGASANVEGADGWTPLHTAVAADALDTGELLLDHGADPNARAKDRLTPLHFAVLRDAKEARDTPRFVRLLLERGAKVNPRALDIAVTPTDVARTAGLGVTEALLRRYGGDVSVDEKHELVGAAHWATGAGRGVLRPIVRRTLRRRKPRNGAPYAQRSRRSRRRKRR